MALSHGDIMIERANGITRRRVDVTLSAATPAEILPGVTGGQ